MAIEAGDRLVRAFHSLWNEASALRFRINFGTPICDHCDGLRAGPDVVATCFQVKQCNYESVKEGAGSPRQHRVLQNLLEVVRKDLTTSQR